MIMWISALAPFIGPAIGAAGSFLGSKKKGKGIKGPKTPDPVDDLDRALEYISKNQSRFQDIKSRDTKSAFDDFLKYGPLSLAAQLGMGEEFAPKFQGLGQRLASSALRGDIDRLSAFTPSLIKALRGARNPEEEELRDIMRMQLREELATGGDLSARERRDAEQDVRQAQTARGISRGAAPITEEVKVLGQERLRRRRGAQQAAQNFLRNQASTTIDPAKLIMGRSPGTASPFLGSGFQLPGAGNTLGFVGGLQGELGESSRLNSQLSYNLAQLNAKNKSSPLGAALGGFLDKGGGSAVSDLLKSFGKGGGTSILV